MNQGDLAFDEATDQDLLRLGDGFKDCVDATTLGVCPPTASDRFAGNGLGDARTFDPPRSATTNAHQCAQCIRVRPGSGEVALGFLSQQEVALILRISVRAVRAIEQRAFDKLRNHPGLKDYWREWVTGEVEETATRDSSQWLLSRAELAAVYGLAQTAAERQALRKLFALMQGARP
jgi:Sigma-70, region 4